MYRGELAHQRGRSAGIDLSPLPEAIRRELAWCVFRIIAQGGKVDVTHMRALARRLGHADVQTTLNVYGHVTEDAELRAAADWKALTGRWLAAPRAEDLAGACL